jgi:thiol-disulfide isomerase/thioredoxin
LKTVKGRVVTSDGKGVPNLTLQVEFENLYVDEEGNQEVVAEHPTAYDILTTDREGKFECRLPKGKTSISALWDSGYYSEPNRLEFSFEDQAELPEYIVKPMPVLKGVAVDETGQPVPNAILRLLDHTDKYVFADQEGRFEVPVAALDYDDESQCLSKFKTLAAFDLGSKLCCVENVDVSNQASITNLTLKLKDHPVDWLLKRVQESSEKRLKRILAFSNYASEDVRQIELEQAELRANYKLAPDLNEGSWLKGAGKQSLSDFRGKYVLLDFWFIGCGPCEQEIPNLKLVHQKFKDRNFSVIGIHSAGEESGIVEQFMNERAMDYPMVIDRFDEPIKKAYVPLGLRGYPTYFLINPEGEIDWEAVIRQQILETVRDRILKQEEASARKGT